MADVSGQRAGKASRPCPRRSDARSPARAAEVFLASIGRFQNTVTWRPTQVGRAACRQAVGETPKLIDPTKKPRRQVSAGRGQLMKLGARQLTEC